MQKIYSILILLVCLASPVARAQEPARKPASPLLLNLSILEIDLAPSEDLQSAVRDQARVNGLMAGGKARVLE
ncbi:MAG TPA: hypothetical protein VKC34_02140 [Blastocatellia bacterium]|nr:hypothetical protein [Blastocatellia bacterium]